MQKLKAPFFEHLHHDSVMQDVSEQLDQLEKNVIAITPWKEYSYKPDVQFVIAHNHDCLFIKYFVREESVRAVFRRDSDPVYKDSCVEWFITFNQDPSYYNLEFNSLGTCTVGYGQSRYERTLLPESITKQIRRSASLRIVPVPNEKPVVEWELTLIIPTSVFCYNDIDAIKDQSCRVNFYKCGDDLPTPHYVSWNPVVSEEPNFHLPQYFGELQLL
ncbi:carbohydrate-binding family 9-like protein [Rufibacter roseus]|uniref:Carbohydrate-binding family 9-like protein n=1 Tax=Rufibacter roseus TaxID=1567108 RepID=A0ABW2DRE4_9BACT|nr:carbohydrate-binding family 9-like protein [Rufibacter roseus]